MLFMRMKLGDELMGNENDFLVLQFMIYTFNDVVNRQTDYPREINNFY